MKKTVSIVFVLLWCVWLAHMAEGQAEKPAPAKYDVVGAEALVDPVTVDLLRDKVLLARQVVAARLEALAKLPEYEAYEKALKQHQAVVADVEKMVQALAPGYALDVGSGKLVPAPAATAKR